MESYIVRVYRQDYSNPKNMAGIVVNTSNDTEMRFTSSGELLSLLSRTHEEPELARGLRSHGLHIN